MQIATCIHLLPRTQKDVFLVKIVSELCYALGSENFRCLVGI